MSDHATPYINIGAIGAAIGTFLGYLPSVAALFSIVWLGMQIIINWGKFVAEIKRWFKS